MKLLGALLTLVAGCLAGVYATLRLRQRVKELDFTEEFLTFLETRIRYTADPLSPLLCEAAKTAPLSKLMYLQDIRRLLEMGTPLPEAWQRGLVHGGKQSGLTAADTELLQSLGAGLGQTDLSGQIACLELAHTRLTRQREEARETARNKSKLYGTLGASAGAAAALLLL